MPEKILDKKYHAQLDYNIKSMIDAGFGEDDILKMANDFRDKFGTETGPVPAAKQDIRMFSEINPLAKQQINNPVERESKISEAAKKDKEQSGSYLGAIYDSFISSFDPLKYIGEEALIGGYQYLSGKKVSPELRQVLHTGMRAVMEAQPGAIKKTQKEDYVEQIQSGWDMSDGFGSKDLKALGLMGSRVAGDITVAAAGTAMGLPAGSTYFIQGYGDGLKEIDDMATKENIELNTTTKQGYALTVGAVNSLLEQYGFDKIFGKGLVFKKVQKEILSDLFTQTARLEGKVAFKAIQEEADKLIKKKLSTFANRGLKTLYGAGVEGITEAGQTAAEEGAKKLANIVQGQEIFDEEDLKNNFWKNVANAAAGGVALGAPMGFISTFTNNVDNTVREEIAKAKTPEEVLQITSQLEDVMAKNGASEEEIGLMIGNVKRYNDIRQTLPVNASPEVINNSIELIDRRNSIDEQITQKKAELETTDESLKSEVDSQIKLLEDTKDYINDSIKESVTGEKFVYTEQNGKYYKKFGEQDAQQISRNRYDLQQIKKQEDATTESEKQQQEGGAGSNIGQRQGTQEVKPQETPKTDIGYRYIVGEEGAEVPIAALINKKVRVNGKPAILYQEGRRIVARVIGTNQIIDTFGNDTEMMNALPEDYGIEVDDTIVSETPRGYKVDGEDMVNDNENPLDAISTDQNGNVMNVVLKTQAGKRRKYRGQVAKDLAYQITLKETLKNEDEFELFLEQEHKAELDAAEAKAAAEAEATRANEAVPQQEQPAQPAAPSTTVPTYGRITANRDESKPVKGRLAKKLVDDAKRVLKSLSNLGDFSVNVHDQNSFEKAVLEAGGTQEDSVSRGFYLSSNGEIHINIDKATKDTVLHEGFHPILDFMAERNPKVVNELYQELSAIPEAADIIDMVNQQYEGDMTQKKEAITNFVAGVANGDIVINPSNFAKIRRFIANLLKKLGLPIEPKVLMEVNNPTKLVELAKFISENFKKGWGILPGELDQAARAQSITFDGVDLIVGDETQDPVTVSNIAVVDPIQFQKIPVKDKVFKKVDIKWVAKGMKLVIPKSKSSLYNIVLNSGGAVVVINSDATGIGMKKGVLRQGGIGYTFIEQNVQDNIGFAASMDSKQTAFFKAVQEAASIRDKESPNMKGKPVAIFVMVQAPEVMFGNAYGADYFIKAISNALSHNEISTEEAKANIIEYFNSIKESNATGRKYANSIDALINLINKSNLKSATERKKIYELLITNRVDKEDKSAKFGFDARRVLFGQFFNKVGVAKNKPGGKLRDILDKDGFNHKNFYDIYGDENVIKNLDGKTEGVRLEDGGFTMTGFYVDPTMTEDDFVQKSKSGKFIHKQFNGRFFGSDPFVLDGKYYVNEIFPEARFIDKYGKPVPVSTSTAGSMYPRTKTEPQSIVERAKAISEVQWQKAASEDIVNGFYSPIENRVKTFKQPKASAQKWKDIVGIKSDESVFSGLSDWLNNKKPDQQLSKEDVLNFMKENRIEIKEIIGSENDETLPSSPVRGRITELQLPGGENYKEILITLPKKYKYPSNDFTVQRRRDTTGNKDNYRVSDETEDYFVVEGPRGSRMPVYKDYYTKTKDDAINNAVKRNLEFSSEDEWDFIDKDGNYFNTEFQPTKEDAIRNYMNSNKVEVGGFKSLHFNEPNIITHLRMNTRTDVDGKKVLFLEEVQSDWGQKGKKEGFENKETTNGIPSAPYVTNTNAWVKLGLKVALKEAVKQGADRIAWTTGEQQNDRYSLSNEVESIKATRKGTPYFGGKRPKNLPRYYTLKFKYKNGEDGQTDLQESELEDYVGKELAERIIADGSGEYSGVDLNVGGKGMKAFYGDAKNSGIVGNVAKALVKELTGKEGELEVSKIEAGEQPAIEIIPELRQAVQGGIPQFQKKAQITIKWEKSKEGKGDPSISSRNPIVQDAAKNLKEGKITNEEYRATVSANSPISPITRFFEPATEQEIRNAFSVATKKDIEAENIGKPIEEGKKVGVRLDIPSYKYNNTWVVSIHEGHTRGGKVISYSNVAKIKNVSFEPIPLAALNIAAGEASKTSVARMYGEWVNIKGDTLEEKGENAKKIVEDIVNDSNYVQVGMNPFRYSYFYDRSSDIGRPIKSADEVIQIGGLVYAKNPVYGNWTDESYRVKELFDKAGAPVQFQKATPTKAIEKNKKGTVKTFLQKNFTTSGLLGREVLKFKEQMGGEISAEMDKAERYSKKVMELIKKYSNIVTQQQIEDALTGVNSQQVLPTDLITALADMRGHIDNLTQRLIDLGVITAQESIDLYNNNKGQYMLRSYELFNTKATYLEKLLLGKAKTAIDVDNVTKKLKNVDQAVLDRALQFLTNQTLSENPLLTIDQAREKAKARANAILADTDTGFSGKGMDGSVNVSSLQQRQQLAPEIRALMGEYTDPVYRYYSTIFKLAGLTSNRSYLNKLKAEGLNKFLFTSKTKDASVQIAGKESEALEPLNGLWTFPEIKEALQMHEPLTTSIIQQFAGNIRKFKTVYNPGTHVKNILGNMGFFISNGHWTYAGESWDYVKDILKGKDSKKLLELTDVLNRNGVLNSSVGLNELKSYFDRYNNVDDFLSAINNTSSNKKVSTIKKIGNKLNAIPKAAENLYQKEDDIFKILAFVNESNRYSKALYKTTYSKLTDAQRADVISKTSEIVKNTYPTFSRVPKFVRGISKAMFLGNFLSFPVESIRVSIETMKLAKQEISSGNDALRTIGITRLVGSLAYQSLFAWITTYMSMAAASGIGGMIGAFFDDDDQKKRREEMKKYRAPWNKESEVINLKFSDGVYSYMDIGSLDSYNYQRQVWNTFWNNANKPEDVPKAVLASAARALDPYLEFDMTYQTFLNLYNNEDEFGKRIYNPALGYSDRMLKQGTYAAKKFAPGAIAAAMRVYKSYDEEDFNSVTSEVRSQFFARQYSIDLKKQFASYMYAETDKKNTKDVGFKNKLENAKDIYSEVKYRKGATKEEIEYAYQLALEKYKSELKNIKSYYDAAISGGVPEKELDNILNRSRIGGAEAMSIRTGNYNAVDGAYIRK